MVCWVRRITLKMTQVVCLSLFLLVGVVNAWSAEVDNVRVWHAPDHTRLVFDLSGPITHQLFALSDPDRIVIDIPDTQMQASLEKLKLKGSPLQRVRSGVRNQQDLRIVLDLSRKAPPRSFELSPNDQYGHRLVVDLLNEEKPKVVKTVTSPAGGTLRDVVIAIDAGHGGEDPGAIGPKRLREKTVVLAIARELAQLLEREKGFKPVLIRKGDYYIPLRQRTQLARDSAADMFVSVHADAFKNPQANGASVWALSERGASSETGRWLASRENGADLIGGVGSVSLDDKNEVLAGVLLDMSMTASLSDSLDVGAEVLKNMGSIARLHKKHVEQAGFVVLKSPDIPSILVETGFISNPKESSRLRKKSYQKKMAKSIFSGIKRHFTRKPPANSYIAWSKNGGDKRSIHYKVVKGDSLSVIAVRNGTSLDHLRQLNSLKSDQIRVGQVLQVPAS